MDEKRTVIRVIGNTLSIEKETDSVKLVFETNSESEHFLFNMLIKTGFIEKDTR